VNNAGSVYMHNCDIASIGRGIFQNSGTTEFTGTMNVSIKCLANHGGTMKADGHFKATGATGSDAVISTAGGTTWVNGTMERTTATTGCGIFTSSSAVVYASGSIVSSGDGIQNGATCSFVGTIDATGRNALRCTGGALNASGTFEADTVAVVCTGGAVVADGVFKTASGSSNTGVVVSGGTCYLSGSFDTGGAICSVSGGTLGLSGQFRPVGTNAFIITAGTIKLDGRLETSFSGIVPGGTGAKTIDVGNLIIEITGANTARRLINYTDSTNVTMTIGTLRGTVPSGAAESISTDAANTQTITAGAIYTNAAIDADVTVSAFGTLAP
jgi:hypothetical protein